MKPEAQSNGLLEVIAFSLMGLIISLIVTLTSLSAGTDWVVAYLE
jgi:hypothetical protein